MRELWWPRSVPRIQMPHHHLSFYREFVSQSRPCVIVNAFDDWPALNQWTIPYLKAKAGDLKVSLDITPSGHGDCVVNTPDTIECHLHNQLDDYYHRLNCKNIDLSKCFVKPMQVKVPFEHALDHWSSRCKNKQNNHKYHTTTSKDFVYYLQHQNDNFRKEFAARLDTDIRPNVEQWGTLIFGSEPDAINFWMGDSHAVSSLHKDHYENLYCVIHGKKTFTLLPPTDLPWLYQTWYRQARYTTTDQGMEISMESSQNPIPWIPIDPDTIGNQNVQEQYPKSVNISPITVTLNAGEMLYLPSLVYHKVAQEEDEEGKVIAINYWWDMTFGTSYTYYKMLEAMLEQRRLYKS